MARNVARFSPMRDVSRLGVFPNIEDIFRELSTMPLMRGAETEPRMRVDIEENEQAYILRAEVPGAKREDIKVSIEGNRVSIRADVEDQRAQQESASMLRVERIFGEEFRTFTLPHEIDESKAEARIENGILVLTLPKKSGAGGRQLTVQ